MHLIASLLLALALSAPPMAPSPPCWAFTADKVDDEYQVILRPELWDPSTPHGDLFAAPDAHYVADGNGGTLTIWAATAIPATTKAVFVSAPSPLVVYACAAGQAPARVFSPLIAR